MLNANVPQGTFSRNFVKGAGSGALMMGIFSSLIAVTAFTFPMIGLPVIAASHGIGATLGMIGLGSVATGLFTGITATQRAAEASHSANTVSHAVSRAPVRAPEQAIAPAMERATHNSRAWTERVSQDRSNHPDRMSGILADRSLDDKGRAAAILREREQSNTSEARR